MPVPKKPPGMAVDKRNGQRVSVIHNLSAVDRFDPPAGLCDTANAAWDAYWSDRPAQLLTPTSKHILVRWVENLDRYCRYIDAVDREPTVTTFHGGLSVNPVLRIAAQALRVVEVCEKQLGIGVLNATYLGLAALAEARNVEDLNARYSQPQQHDGDVVVLTAYDDQEVDPRRDLAGP